VKNELNGERLAFSREEREAKAEIGKIKSGLRNPQSRCDAGLMTLALLQHRPRYEHNTCYNMSWSERVSRKTKIGLTSQEGRVAWGASLIYLLINDNV
jgi:hypothetical protein